MRVLYFDCFAGASGDMMLGALAELLDAERGPGSAVALLDETAAALGLDGVRFERTDVVRCGIGATKVTVLIAGAAGPDPGVVDLGPGGGKPDHGHDHPHEHSHAHGDEHDHGPAAARPGAPRAAHAHRTLADVEEILAKSGLAAPVRERSLAVFRRLVEAEASVHRMPAATVHLHEVGALDAIADVAGSVALLHALAPDRVVVSPVNVGGGTVDCAHGRYPVPGPAAAALLQGLPVLSADSDMERVTPTGAALLAAFAHASGPLPAMTLRHTGYGAGTRNDGPRPNVLRALLGEAAAPGGIGEVVVIECTIDDMNPQNYGHLLERLSAAGALDVFLTPVLMKKNRPATLVTALCEEAAFPALTRTIFAETTTIGLRWRRDGRIELERRFDPVETPWGTVRVKVSSQGASVFTAQAEYEDCRRIAVERGVPLKDVQAAALSAWRAGAGPQRA